MEAMMTHPWESAGLGPAPYKWLGVFEDRGPHRIERNGVTVEVGAPGQPMGCCAYCAQGIAECHRIRAADGREFIVGCECVRRVSDPGSPVLTAAAAAARQIRNRKAREHARVRAAAVKQEIERLFDDPDWCARVRARSHPNQWRQQQGETLLDSFYYRYDVSGAAGRARLLKEMLAIDPAANSMEAAQRDGGDDD